MSPEERAEFRRRRIERNKRLAEIMLKPDAIRLHDLELEALDEALLAIARASVSSRFEIMGGSDGDD